METTLGLTLALALVGLSSIFLLTTMRFGITHGEMRIGQESAHLAAQINRAGNIAIVLFLASAVCATLILLNFSGLLLPRMHWLIRFTGLLIAVALCSYGLAILSLVGIAPDFVISLEQILSRWLMGAAR